jgi:DtxR family Mn-dependent transcriptional regulator
MESKLISPALEGYVEIIADLINEKKVARVRDIAEKKSVSMASVNGALKRLAEKGFIKHNPYEFIELTDAGEKLALKMDKKHSVIRRFFQEVLHIDPKIADKDACTIEHHLSPETIQGMNEFFSSWDAGVMPVRPPVEKDISKAVSNNITTIPLRKRVIVKCIHAPSNIKKRLMEMGLLPGTKIQVKRIAPLGDPMEIELKGYSLSLRKSEAKTIEVTTDE